MRPFSQLRWSLWVVAIISTLLIAFFLIDPVSRPYEDSIAQTNPAALPFDDESGIDWALIAATTVAGLAWGASFSLGWNRAQRRRTPLG